MLARKILFIQGFSLKQPGGGAEILKKLILYASQYDNATAVAVDVNEIPNDLKAESLNEGELQFETNKRNYRFGLGRIKGFMMAMGLSSKGKNALNRILENVQPDVIHITAHGIGFPLYFAASRLWKHAKIVVSVHDLWTLTVKSYVPLFIGDFLFRKILAKADMCYVISPEMGNYLTEKYELKNYTVIHDGFVPDHTEGFTKTVKLRTGFIYAGLMHGLQSKIMYQLLDAMSAVPDTEFSIGICSNTTLVKKENHKNIEVVNYGWVDSSRFKEISRSYAFGILPLSFSTGDNLFYRTSLMTKIPFYLKHHLPILCIGPSNAAARHNIINEKTGICVEKEGVPALINAVKEIVYIPEGKYVAFLKNGQTSLQKTFNAEVIAERFYNSLQS